MGHSSMVALEYSSAKNKEVGLFRWRWFIFNAFRFKQSQANLEKIILNMFY